MRGLKLAFGGAVCLIAEAYDEQSTVIIIPCSTNPLASRSRGNAATSCCSSPLLTTHGRAPPPAAPAPPPKAEAPLRPPPPEHTQHRGRTRKAEQQTRTDRLSPPFLRRGRARAGLLTGFLGLAQRHPRVVRSGSRCRRPHHGSGGRSSIASSHRRPRLPDRSSAPTAQRQRRPVHRARGRLKSSDPEARGGGGLPLTDTPPGASWGQFETRRGLSG